ncbi:MAG TPA: FAD-dependent oxidoreductase [Acidimicrobiia bacterium]|nr:FAD-dependent oxidoreductase [Acidimicrobiia bacterium]
MDILVLGGSFGGMTAAYELRRQLQPGDARIVVIAKDPRFTFIPSLPWVAMGWRKMDAISFELDRPLARKEIEFVAATVEKIDPDRRTVSAGGHEYGYDRLVIATGHRSANEAVPGLGPFDGPGHSLMSPPEAEEARTALEGLLADRGPVVIGCAPGASCIGPAYEFAFELDHLLRRRRLRHEVPIVFVTPEPQLGHFGIAGVGKARQFLEGAFEERDIRYLTSAAVSKITDSSVELGDGQSFESRYSMIIPPLAGVRAVADTPGLSNPKGFVPVDDHYRHGQFPEVYAAGVAVAMAPVEDTPVPVNFPKTGHMTEQMATIAAHNLVADVRGTEPSSHPLGTECILDMGDRGVHIKVDPVRPPRNEIPTVTDGRRWLWAKRAFERFYLARAKRGRTGTRGWGW